MALAPDSELLNEARTAPLRPWAPADALALPAGQEAARLGFSVGDEPVDMVRLTRELARIVEAPLQLVGHPDEAHRDGLGGLQAEARAKSVGERALLRGACSPFR